MADDKELEAIVQGMIDADESEEDIAAVIRAYHAPKPGSGLNKPIKSPTTWGQGFMKSLTDGEAAMAGLKGLGGFAKGAIVDLIPDTLTGMVDMARASHINPNIADRVATSTKLAQGVMDAPGAIADATMKAGSKPYEFGEMMGKITGQPAVGALAGKMPIPSASAAARPVRALGRATKNVGSVVRDKTPVSSLLPRAASIPLAETLESAVGSGISKIGDRVSKVGLPKVLQNTDYGPVPFEGGPRLSPTGDMKGGVSYPTLNEAPEMVPNAAAAVDEFIPGGRAITGPNKGSVTYPELNDTPPSLVPNEAAAMDEFIPGGRSITGPNKGSVAYPEMNDTPPSLMQNSDYGPVEFTPNGPLSSPTGPNKGGMSYPEMADTPPSLVPNSQAATSEFMDSIFAPTGEGRGGMSFPDMSEIPEGFTPNNQAAMDEFMQSISAPGGEMRGSMSFPETNPMPQGVMHNSDYGPGYSSSPERLSDWGMSNRSGRGPNLWAEPSGADTAILNYDDIFEPLPAAREWKPPVKEKGPSLEVIEDSPISNNASGESGASMEAMSRLKAMAAKGEKFVVIDRAGRVRPLIGADAVDYVPQMGETFGIQGPTGFKPLSSNKGFVPKHLMAQ